MTKIVNVRPYTLEWTKGLELQTLPIQIDAKIHGYYKVPSTLKP
jgi:hypothetical protein